MTRSSSAWAKTARTGRELWAFADHGMIVASTAVARAGKEIRMT
jgi:hypothetical protein